MKSILLLILVLSSFNSYSAQNVHNLAAQKASFLIDQATYSWLQQHHEAAIEIEGHWRERYSMTHADRQLQINRLIAYRLCYEKNPSGIIRYCYELDLNASARLNE